MERAAEEASKTEGHALFHDNWIGLTKYLNFMNDGTLKILVIFAVSACNLIYLVLWLECLDFFFPPASSKSKPSH